MDSLTTQSLVIEMKSHSSYHRCLAVCFSFTVCTQVINLLCSASSWHITWHRKIHQQVVKHAKYFQSNELHNKALLRENAALSNTMLTDSTLPIPAGASWEVTEKCINSYHFCSTCRKFLRGENWQAVDAHWKDELGDQPEWPLWKPDVTRTDMGFTWYKRKWGKNPNKPNRRFISMQHSWDYRCLEVWKNSTFWLFQQI